MAQRQQKRNAAEDVIDVTGDVDEAMADQILEQWMRDYPVPRNPLFNLSLMPNLPVRKTLILWIGGPSHGVSGLERDLDVQIPLTINEVRRFTRQLVDDWRALPRVQS